MIRASESLIWFQSVLSLSSGSAQFVFPSQAPVLYKLANNTRPSGVTPVSTHQFPLSDTEGRADETISKCWQEDAYRMDLCRCMMQRGLNKKTGRQIAWGERLSALDWAFSLWSHLGIGNEACVVCHLSTLSPEAQIQRHIQKMWQCDILDSLVSDWLFFPYTKPGFHF